MVVRIEIETRPALVDALGEETRIRLASLLHLGGGGARVRTRKVYLLDLSLSATDAAAVADALTDAVVERGAVGALPDEDDVVLLTVGLRPGVTDSVGTSVHRAAEDRLGRSLPGRVYTATMYRIWGLSPAEVRRAADELLHNPLIQTAKVESPPRTPDLEVPRAGSPGATTVATVPLCDASDEALLALSHSGMLALNLVEMQAIAGHFRERGRDPTDAELECLAQTWSEHCKHKIFAAPIEYTDPDGHTALIDEGLFRRYVRGATEAIDETRRTQGMDPDGAFLVSVFHDNAGVVRLSDADHLVYKVETHNSPSALDPYGGAMTGIVGVNRDSYGTGIGADLLTNVWGYCLGPPNYDGALPKGLMPPHRIRDGVHRGVIDGGNQSGIPQSRGFERFDPRYAGKPLVFCGTVAVMPVTAAGHPAHEKRAEVGDYVVMVGGRIGKDGIHGATFSSVELADSSPVQAVQIGDPITQKMMFDALAEARDRGLYRSITDNGAGGLSSSVGEMAEATGGAHIDLAKAPLKYPGLQPWEILISEAQERMTLAVAPERLDELLALCRRREVEASVLGTFDDSGRLHVTHGELEVADLPLSFLHDGLPRTQLQARWSPPPRPPATEIVAGLQARPLAQLVLELCGSPDFRSYETLRRHYDHEVKGLSVVKPMVGRFRDVGSTATVMRVRHGRDEGVVLGEGIHPAYGDIDTDAMARACVDEAVRRVLCAGARPDRLSALDNFCWPDPIQSDKTPDGEHKLAQLVRCCQGLYDACIAYGVPLVSGKDSMKNDSTIGGVKISIPPTLLVSVMGQMPDVRQSLSLCPRAVGDAVILLGPTADELGGSAVYQAAGVVGEAVPRTDLAASWSRYERFVAARDQGLVRSAHALGRGGLAMALCDLVLASDWGLDIDLDPAARALDPFTTAFSESTGRIIVTVAPEHEAPLLAAIGSQAQRIGVVTDRRCLRLTHGGHEVMDLSVDPLREAFVGEAG